MREAQDPTSEDVVFLPMRAQSARAALDSAVRSATAARDLEAAKLADSALDDAILLCVASESLVKSCSEFSNAAVDSFSKLGALQMAWNSDEIAGQAEAVEKSAAVVADVIESCLAGVKKLLSLDSPSVEEEAMVARAALEKMSASADDALASIKSLWDGD